MSKNLSIRQRLYLILIILSLPLSLLMIYSVYGSYRKQIDQIHTRSTSMARATSIYARSIIGDARNILDELAARPLVRAFDPNRCDPIIRDLKHWHSKFEHLLTARRLRWECRSLAESASFGLHLLCSQ
jgi:hypothetical protein